MADHHPRTRERLKLVLETIALRAQHAHAAVEMRACALRVAHPHLLIGTLRKLVRSSARSSSSCARRSGNRSPFLRVSFVSDSPGSGSGHRSHKRGDRTGDSRVTAVVSITRILSHGAHRMTIHSSFAGYAAGALFALAACQASAQTVAPPAGVLNLDASASLDV